MSEFVYGKNSFEEALNSGRVIKAFVSGDSSFIPRLRSERIPYEVCDRRTLDRMSKSGNHQGCLAEVRTFKFSEVNSMLKEKNGLIVMLDGLKDPHNLGAIIRSCEGAGVDGLIIRKDRAVGVTETVSKVASGALEYVKIAEVTNLVSTIKKLKNSGYWIVGADGKGKDYYDKLDYDMNTVLIIGSEGEGISRLVLEECDYVVKLPMKGHINSLNASVAAGILIYNVLSRRKYY